MSYIPEHAGTADSPASAKATRRLVVRLTAAAVGTWALSVLLASVLHVEGQVHTVSKVVHVLAMVLSFGAILVVDWHGFLWLLGRRKLAETVRLDGAAGPLIWAGLVLLLASGAFLNPDLGKALTVVKLIAVLVLIVNGIMLIPLMRRLVRLPADTPFGGLGAGQRFHMLACLVVSQACWWTAIVVGFLNSEFS
ncbi:hypothetical protein [Arthrobacter sp. SW1]|uniref:hypothetical protein n=1 Tax=Arthrobacter sp. SW1 TaxID=1920889 RepID=UPI000A989275|nr:hypothetical protein [Arthrobacter sp. SW1]